MVFEDPEGHDEIEEIIAKDEEEIPYIGENEIGEIEYYIVRELRTSGYSAVSHTISTGGYIGTIEISGRKSDYTGYPRNVVAHIKIKYELSPYINLYGTNVLHIRHKATVSFSSEEQEIERLLRGRSSINIMDTFSQRRPIGDMTGEKLIIAQEVQRIYRSVMNFIAYIQRNR
ncbi:MAG: hypothetical protein RXR08_09370 [Sulfolobaceae archaeon]